jgi:hypothetical protein
MKNVPPVGSFALDVRQCGREATRHPFLRIDAGARRAVS